MRRRQPGEVFGITVAIATAEDAVVAKLEWAKLSDSERQLRDVAGILAVRATTLDIPYIEKWVANLGLEAQWGRAQSGLL